MTGEGKTEALALTQPGKSCGSLFLLPPTPGCHHHLCCIYPVLGLAMALTRSCTPSSTHLGRDTDDTHLTRAVCCEGERRHPPGQGVLVSDFIWFIHKNLRTHASGLPHCWTGRCCQSPVLSLPFLSPFGPLGSRLSFFSSSPLSPSHVLLSYHRLDHYCHLSLHSVTAQTEQMLVFRVGRRKGKFGPAILAIRKSSPTGGTQPWAAKGLCSSEEKGPLFREMVPAE